MENLLIKKKTNFNKSKIYALVSAIILVITVIGSTLALVYYRSDTTYVNLTFESNLGAFINYQSGNPVLGSEGKILNSGSDYTSGISTEIEFWKTPEAHNMDIYGHIYLDITSGSSELLNMEGLKWAVTSNDILISEGNFIGYSVGTSLPILVNQKLISSLTKFKIYVWIDENNLGNIAGESESLSVSVRCEATSGEYEIFSVGSVGEFDYTGDIQTTTLTPGTYILETWGAQGGYGMNETYRGGYGGYSVGTITLTESTTLYIAIGGQGTNGISNVDAVNSGGYNGGGSSKSNTAKYVGAGGGATHIATVDGLLSTLSGSINNILIVSGGGGAGAVVPNSYDSTGGDAGGYVGNAGTTTHASKTIGQGGTQTVGGSGYTSGSFGMGATYSSSGEDRIGGGSGFYGGGSGLHSAGSGGGSGYIGNTLLTNKVMYCYNCSESSEESTKTVSTTCVSEEATSNCAKMGNGYARITSNATIKVLPRVTVSNGTDYNFKENISSEIPSGYTITYSTYDNASTLSSGEYQIKYIAEDSNGNEYTYYQKVEIV